MYPLYNFITLDFITHFMLPKNRRIARKDFPYILKNGKRYNSPALMLYVAPADPIKNPEPSKFSFSVSKKVCPKAVDRNKYRRRGYSVVSKNLNHTKPGHFCFFSFKKTPKPVNFQVLENEVKGLLSASGVLI